MAIQEFLLPDVGEGLEAGIIVKWLVSPGEKVTVDQIIVEIETDKALVEIPAPVTGTLISHGGKAGATLPVGSVLATFQANDGVATSANKVQPVESSESPASALSGSIVTDTQSGTTEKRILASPATRKFARNNQIDLTLISGTGSRGQVTQKDVESFISSGGSSYADNTLTAEANVVSQPTAISQTGSVLASNPPRATLALKSHTEPLSGLRKQIASNMQSAWRDIPHVFSFEEIDATALIEARHEFNTEYERQGQRVSFLPFFVKACVIALHEHPRFNASINMTDETVNYHGHCNIGIATATPEGLIVTVVHHAEQKSIIEIGNEITSLAALARERRVTVDQIKGSTFTISNFGSYGGTLGTPIIRPPEVAIAGFGRIHEKVVPRNGEPVVRHILPLAVSTDHRLNDGEHLGGFVSTIGRLLSNPVRMLGHL